jgi:uncharacterized protein
MKIWVDADACPGPVRDILLRAAERLKVPAVFVANKRLTLPRSELVSSVQVGAGLDVADRLSVRNFMQELRDSGVMTGGPGGFSPRDKQEFAATLDRELTRLLKARG